MRKVIPLLFLFLSFVVAAQEYRPDRDRSGEDHKRSTDLRPTLQDDKWGYAAEDGHMVIRPQFSLAHNFSEGLALVYEGGARLSDPVVKSFVKMGYIDQKGRWVIQSRFKYYYYYDFSEGLVSFRQLSKGWGYINPKGKVIVRPHFQWAGTFVSGVAPVLLDDRCGHIDKSGRLTDQARSVLPRRKGEQDRRGNFQDRPEVPPCS